MSAQTQTASVLSVAEIFTMLYGKPEFSVTVKKAGKAYTFDSTLPVHVLAEMVVYGAKQKLGDSASDQSLTANVDGRRVPLKGKELEAAKASAVAVIDETFADLCKGIIGKTRSSKASVEKRAYKIAYDRVEGSEGFALWLSENGLNKTDKRSMKELQSRAEHQALLPKIVALATRQLADEAELDEPDEVSEAASIAA
jgi:hypothetical protein